MIKFHKIAGVFALGAMVALGGCASDAGDEQASAEHHENDGHDHSGHDHGSETAAAPSPELKSVVLTEGAPTQVIGVAQARDAAQPDQEVTIEGRLKDFVSGKAAFTVVDGAIKSCIEEGDGCTTPWDYCCVAPNKLAENTATVKIVDAEGKLLDGNLEGVNSIDNLSTVVVTGKIETDPTGNVAIAAQKVYLK